MNKKITIVGIGMDGAKTLTGQALAAIENADVLIGAGRMLAPFEGLNKPTLQSYDGREIAGFISACEHEKIAVLMSGDCGFYSGAKKLLPLLGEWEVEVICGISSPVYFCSKLKLPWSGLHFVSLHGCDGNIVRNVMSHEYTFFLLGGTTAKEVCARLTDYGLGGLKVYIGENLACENERIISGSAAEMTDVEVGRLSVMLVENPRWESGARSCIPDGEFIRGNIPMTKAEVRCVSVAKLEVGSGDICWDIGGGTGSVSVEMALRCPDGKVWSVDRNTEAAELIDKNRRKFGCDNIEIICEDAEKALETLPGPDRVFIGGSGGKLGKIISAAYSMNPKAIIVVTAVSLETLRESAAAFENLGAEAEMTQIAVTRTKKAGSHTMLAAENPVFIIKGKLL